MKHSETKSPDDMCSPSESLSEWPERLDLEIPKEEAKIELDEEDQNDLNAEAWYFLQKMQGLRLNKQMRSDIIKLIARFEETLGWYKRN